MWRLLRQPHPWSTARGRHSWAPAGSGSSCNQQKEQQQRNDVRRHNHGIATQRSSLSNTDIFSFWQLHLCKTGTILAQNSDGNLVASSFVASRKGPRCFCTGVDLPNQRAAREATIVRMTPKLFGGGNWELYDADPKQNDPHCLPCIVQIGRAHV